MLIGQSISFPSKFIILEVPLDMIFLIIKGLDHLGFIFLLDQKFPFQALLEPSPLL